MRTSVVADGLLSAMRSFSIGDGAVILQDQSPNCCQQAKYSIEDN